MTLAEKMLYKITVKAVTKARKEDKIDSFIQNIVKNETNGLSTTWLLDNELITVEELVHAIK